MEISLLSKLQGFKFQSNLSEGDLDPTKWELIQICSGQLSNARRCEGERGGEATPVLGQEPRSTAA